MRRKGLMVYVSCCFISTVLTLNSTLYFKQGTLQNNSNLLEKYHSMHQLLLYHDPTPKPATQDGQLQHRSCQLHYANHLPGSTTVLSQGVIAGTGLLSRQQLVTQQVLLRKIWLLMKTLQNSGFKVLHDEKGKQESNQRRDKQMIQILVFYNFILVSSCYDFTGFYL